MDVTIASLVEGILNNLPEGVTPMQALTQAKITVNDYRGDFTQINEFSITPESSDGPMRIKINVQ